MPFKSKAQQGLMEAARTNPAFAKKVGVPQSVAQDFHNASKGKTGTLPKKVAERKFNFRKVP